MSQIYFEGFEETQEAIAKLPFLSRSAGEKALIVAAGMMVSSAKDNIRNNNSVVTGNLFQSVVMKKEREDGDLAILVGSAVAYAYNYEFGMPAGEEDIQRADFPERIQKWAAMKGLSPEDASAIVEHIRKNGTKPHPFLMPAVNEHAGKIEELMTKSIKQEVEK